MKVLIVIAILAVSLTATLASPRTQAKIQIKAITPLIEFEELIQLVSTTLYEVGEINRQTELAITDVLTGDALTEAVRILVEANNKHHNVLRDAIDEALFSPREEYPDIIGRALQNLVPVVTGVVADIRKVAENESEEVRAAIEAILLKYTEDIIQAVHPLVEAIGGEGGVRK